MNNFIKKQGGITLIALVITIIVLLLLAGISISMLSGQDGILNKAREAKVKNVDGMLKDEVALWEYEKLIGKSENSTVRTEEEFFKQLYNNGLVDSEEPHTIKDIDGNIIYEKENVMLSFTIDGVENTEGTEVYFAEEGMTWNEWIGSEYNNMKSQPIEMMGQVIMNSCITVTEYTNNTNGNVYALVGYRHGVPGLSLFVYNNTYILENETIVDNRIYTLSDVNDNASYSDLNEDYLPTL